MGAIAMNTRKALVALAAITTLGILDAAALAGTEREDHGQDRGGAVVPCSLAGVNPAHHPEIFGNAAAAKSFGFVQAPDHTWHVRADCRS
jgi:hypothetical protein